MRCGTEINGNMEQSTSVRATLLCQRLQTSAHHRSNEYLTVPCLLFYRLYFYDSLEIRFIECKPWVQSTVGPNKAPWDGIDAQVKVVYYSSLQWTVDTSHRNIDSERDLQRYLFFHCAQRYAVWGSGISLMMQSDSKMTHPAMCLAHHESNSFSIWTYIFFPVLFMFELCLTISYIYMFHD